ncbi:hypothetical protein M9H77_05234 [Catharanthus roseus]|uniref:Uncharacterized protein n=1 Tax=Catharanthus roseus TaxID=4058 RepID=A0ACC0CGC7_CATRO|nr:hypothetical protein M9H77_05234 [Catharanthus roseus]
MARVSLRDFLKLRTSFLYHSSSPSSLIQPSKPAPFSYIASSDLTDSRTYPLYKKILDFLDLCKNSLTHLFQIQAHLITSGLLQHPSFAGRILTISSDLCALDYTVLIFRCIQFPSTFCVNTVIKACSCGSVPQMAMVLYTEMLKDGFFPNSFSFPPLLSACSRMGSLNLGRQCHGQAVKNGVDIVLPVQNSLIHFYACVGLMDSTMQVLDEISVKDVVSWNSVIGGLAKAGELGLAHKLFDGMPDRNVISWNIMITGYLNARKPGNGIKLFREMVMLGFRGNCTTIVNLLTACGRSARLKEGKSVHGSLIRNFNDSSLIIDTSLIDMYSRCGRVDLARLIFDRMLVKNIVSWNVMILGYCLHGNPIDGLSLYAEMTARNSRLDREDSFCKSLRTGDGTGIIPDEVTFIGVLCACARLGLLTEGKNYFSQMTEVFGVKPNFAHYWCMANIFARVDLRTEAIELLRNIPIDIDESAETTRWAGLFSSCRFEEDISFGEQLARELIEQDPKNFSYYALLVNVYAVAGRWEDVLRTKAMIKENGIEKIAGCGLEDLTEIVHRMKVGKKWQESIESWQISTQEVNH